MDWWLQTLKESDIKFYQNDRTFHHPLYTITIGLSSLRVSRQSISNSAASYKKSRHSAIRPHLLIVERIVDGVAQSRDEVGLWYQRHTLLDQKLCLGKVTKQTRREESKENGSRGISETGQQVSQRKYNQSQQWTLTLNIQQRETQETEQVSHYHYKDGQW